MFNPFKRKEAAPVEKRGHGNYTSEIIGARESYFAGARGQADLTATVQGCVTLWENAFTLADVDGTDMLDRASLGIMGRSLALRGEWVAYITDDGLCQVSDWIVTTRNGKPTAYQLTLPDVNGGHTVTALAAEVLHVRIGASASTPYFGTSPLSRASLSAGLLHTLETALAEVYDNAPLGSQIIPFPESPENDLETLGRGFRGRRGSVLLRESVAVTAAGGAAPTTDWHPSQVSPDMQKTMASQSHQAAKADILNVFGVLPALVASTGTGPMTREAQRHLAQWHLQPMAMLLSEEATNKLGQPVMVDVLRPTQAYDVGGRARALSAIVKAMAEAKAAGVEGADFEKALTLVNWGVGDNAA